MSTTIVERRSRSVTAMTLRAVDRHPRNRHHRGAGVRAPGRPPRAAPGRRAALTVPPGGGRTTTATSGERA